MKAFKDGLILLVVFVVSGLSYAQEKKMTFDKLSAAKTVPLGRGTQR